MCTLLPNGWQNRFLLFLHCSLLPKSLYSGELQLPSPPLGLKRFFRPPWEEVFDWVISSDLLPLNDPGTPTLLHRSSPDISFAPSSLAPGRCYRTWVVTIYQFFYPSISLRSIASTSVPLSSIFRKLAGMTLTLTVPLHRNTRLFPLLLLSLPLWHWMRPNLPFLSVASNALLKPGGLLRWKKRLVKDARLLLPLTEVMKIARLTSPLLDAPRQSSPRPRLRRGK